MKYMTKIEWILNDEDFMICSDEVKKKQKISEEKLGKPLTSKMQWRIVDKQIQKKVKRPSSVKGICACNSNYLCKHRKKYLKEILENG